MKYLIIILFPFFCVGQSSITNTISIDSLKDTYNRGWLTLEYHKPINLYGYQELPQDKKIRELEERIKKLEAIIEEKKTVNFYVTDKK